MAGNCPGFISLAGLDFHLLATAPGVNAGTVLAAQFSSDYDGRSRGASGWDLGALEQTNITTLPAAPTNLRIIR